MKNTDTELTRAVYKVQDELEYYKWMEEIPGIPLEKLSRYIIKIIPPFLGAIIRFKIINPRNSNMCSVYLDAYNFLGYYGDYNEPYWEVYIENKEPIRISIQDIDELIDTIINFMENINLDNL